MIIMLYYTLLHAYTEDMKSAKVC